MNRSKCPSGWLALLAILVLSPLPLEAKENSTAIDLARQLNQAFIEVADKVSPAVVVIKLAHKPDYRDLDDGSNPFLDMVPELRKRFEEQFKKRQPAGGTFASIHRVVIADACSRGWSS